MKIMIPEDLIKQYTLVGGIYDATITNVDVRVVKSLPQEFVGMPVEDISDEYKYLNIEYTLANGQKVWGMLSLKATAMWRLVQLLDHLRINLEEIAKKGLKPTILIGKTLKVNTVVEEYNGKQSLKVTDFVK